MKDKKEKKTPEKKLSPTQALKLKCKAMQVGPQPELRKSWGERGIEVPVLRGGVQR